MNIKVTSKQEILNTAINLVKQNGIKSIGMRVMAESLDVSLGSLYNYYKSKDELLLDVIAYIWEDIFDLKEEIKDSFIAYIDSLFEEINKASIKYPNFMHEHMLVMNKKEARIMMKKYYEMIENHMLITLRNDKRVKKDVFDDKFNDQTYVKYLFRLFISNYHVLNKEEFKHFIERFIYEKVN